MHSNVEEGFDLCYCAIYILYKQYCLDNKYTTAFGNSVMMMEINVFMLKDVASLSDKQNKSEMIGGHFKSNTKLNNLHKSGIMLKIPL